MINIMVDLETMGVGPQAPIMSIGCVVFNADGIVKDDITGEPFEFYDTICLKSTEAMGAKIEADTLLWWLTQKTEALQAITKDSKHVIKVMKALAAWWPKDNVQVWANSPTFDLTKLAWHMKRCKVDVPWTFRDERDFRTMQCSLPNIEWAELGENEALHNALIDARSQVDYLVRILAANKMSYTL